MDVLVPILFFLGFLLLVVEAFIPGFGLAGITGTIFIALGIIKVSNSLLTSILLVLILVIVVAVFFYFIFRSASRGSLGKRLVLNESLTNDHGFSSSKDFSEMVGKTGVALTALRPAGIAEIDNKRMDVQAEGEYIVAGDKIQVICVEGAKLIVKREE